MTFSSHVVRVFALFLPPPPIEKVLCVLSFHTEWRAAIQRFWHATPYYAISKSRRPNLKKTLVDAAWRKKKKQWMEMDVWGKAARINRIFYRSPSAWVDERLALSLSHRVRWMRMRSSVFVIRGAAWKKNLTWEKTYSRVFLLLHPPHTGSCIITLRARGRVTTLRQIE